MKWTPVCGCCSVGQVPTWCMELCLQSKLCILVCFSSSWPCKINSGQPVRFSDLYSRLVWHPGLPAYFSWAAVKGTMSRNPREHTSGVFILCQRWKAECLWAHPPPLLAVELARWPGGWAQWFEKESLAQACKEGTGKVTGQGDPVLFISPGHLLIIVKSLEWNGWRG